MNLVFVSIFLGLVSGVHPVELAAGKKVAAIEIRLDGTTLGRLRGVPWQIDVDFGPATEPHHLEAIGFDASGVEIVRTLQRIKAAFEAATKRLVTLLDGQRIVWLEGEHLPQSISMSEKASGVTLAR